MSPTANVVVITGASSGFGALTARTLAHAGHTVYAGVRHTTGRNAPQVQAAADYACEHGVDLRSIELDVNAQDSVDAAVSQVEAEAGRIDVVLHNAGHMATDPAEAFTPEQLAELYAVNVLSTQRVNRGALPGCAAGARGSCSGCPAAASRAALPRTSPPTSRPKPP